MARKTNTVGNFNRSVTNIRKAIVTAAKRNGGQVSSVDLIGTVPSVTGSRRGAVVRRAFASLVNEGVLRVVKTRGTIKTTYNAETHHRVTVYALRKTRKGS